MPVPVTIEQRNSVRGVGFNAVYAALFFLTPHWAIVLYINSSYLEQFVSARTVSILYVTGSLFTILAFLQASSFLSRFGNVKTAIGLTTLEFVSVLGMAFANSPALAVSFFLIHLALVPLILFSLDIFMEEFIGDKESTTGERRGLLLTVMSITYALAALWMGKLVGAETPDFTLVYLSSALLLLPFFYVLITQFRNFKDPHYPELRLTQGVTYIKKHPDVRNVFFAHFLLQLFFTWMVIYTPIYLATVIGFDWEQIGIILFAGLLAYVFLEYLVGFIADRYIGEKEMMAFGFAVAAISTSWFIFLDDTSVIAWMIAMFMTRVGAAFVETTTESYFFKHTGSRDTNLIGIFRITRPLSYVLGALLGSIVLYTLRFEFIFLILGLMMIPGLFFAMALKDTR